MKILVEMVNFLHVDYKICNDDWRMETNNNHCYHYELRTALFKVFTEPNLDLYHIRTLLKRTNE